MNLNKLKNFENGLKFQKMFTNLIFRSLCILKNIHELKKITILKSSQFLIFLFKQKNKIWFTIRLKTGKEKQYREERDSRMFPKLKIST